MDRFVYAFQGIFYFFRTESNAVIHFSAALIVIIAAFYFKVDTTSWIALIIAITFVFVSEIFNTAIEKLSDFVSPEWSEQIKIVKDLSAAAVLIASISAIIIGILVFSGYIYP